jgi:transcriptional regulator with XRE-family HTH domain
MKQRDVARKMGISKQRYSQLENHKNLNEKRTQEILNALGYTFETAWKYLRSIPPPRQTLPCSVNNNNDKGWQICFTYLADKAAFILMSGACT